MSMELVCWLMVGWLFRYSRPRADWSQAARSCGPWIVDCRGEGRTGRMLEGKKVGEHGVWRTVGSDLRRRVWGYLI
jgi:hypothetical protein